MAHTCPICGMTCHCGGDIDDICFGESDEFCTHCDYDEDESDPDDELNDLQERNDPNDSRNL